MFSLAHISDVHLGPLPAIRRRELISKRITGYVNWRRNRMNSHQPATMARLLEHLKSQNPDHVAVTGDLVNLGLPAEIENARDWLLGLGNPRNVSIVCGNHDAYVPNSLSLALERWQEWVIGDDGQPVSGEAGFPSVRTRDGVSLISCNSARASLPFLATGYFRLAQANRLAEILRREREAGHCRVVLIHHPPAARSTQFHKRLVGARLFRRIIAQEGAELVLHGHTHLASTAWIDGPRAAVPVIGVPSGAQAPGGQRPAARYNLFAIERNRDAWSITMREFGYGESGPDIKALSNRLLVRSD
ncbi:MAG: metallophosphoesterase [Rhizobiaceae bacterium]